MTNQQSRPKITQTGIRLNNKSNILIVDLHILVVDIDKKYSREHIQKFGTDIVHKNYE